MCTSPCAASCRCSSLCSSGAFFVISTALRYTSFEGSCSNTIRRGRRSSSCGQHSCGQHSHLRLITEAAVARLHYHQ
jgi:hypothetical protein